MLDNQMFELLDKLKKVNYETIDIDDFLDQRECDPFDSEWVRVYQAIEELKKGKEMVDTREIEKKAYITVYEKTECDDLAGYIADDFGSVSYTHLDGDSVDEMDDAIWHLETIEEKELPVDEINAYNHMAIYLRWCMEHDLMAEGFMEEYGDVVQKVKDDVESVDLRVFIRDELEGQLFGSLFNQKGLAFASYYYGENDLSLIHI